MKTAMRASPWRAGASCSPQPGLPPLQASERRGGGRSGRLSGQELCRGRGDGSPFRLRGAAPPGEPLVSLLLPPSSGGASGWGGCLREMPRRTLPRASPHPPGKRSVCLGSSVIIRSPSPAGRAVAAEQQTAERSGVTAGSPPLPSMPEGRAALKFNGLVKAGQQLSWPPPLSLSLSGCGFPSPSLPMAILQPRPPLWRCRSSSAQALWAEGGFCMHLSSPQASPLLLWVCPAAYVAHSAAGPVLRWQWG